MIAGGKITFVARETAALTASRGDAESGLLASVCGSLRRAKRLLFVVQASRLHGAAETAAPQVIRFAVAC